MDIRFVRSEDDSSDIMTKNLPRSLHEKHTNAIMTGTLQCWREDVRSDPSVRHFNEKNIQTEGLERETENYFSPQNETHLLDYFSPSFRDSMQTRRQVRRHNGRIRKRSRKPKGQ